MILESIHCPDCNEAIAVIKHGKTVAELTRHAIEQFDRDRYQ